MPSGWWETALPGAFALIGVVLGGWINSRSEAARWRRDYAIDRIGALRTHFAEVVEALNEQIVLCGQSIENAKGERKPVPDGRVEKVDAQWRQAFARRSVLSPESVQRAMTRFDAARGAVATAVNARNVQESEEAFSDLGDARREVLAEISEVVRSMNEVLLPHVVPAPVRWWRRARGVPLLPDDPAPK